MPQAKVYIWCTIFESYANTGIEYNRATYEQKTLLSHLPYTPKPWGQTLI